MRTLDNMNITATCSGVLTELPDSFPGHFTCSQVACAVMAPRREEYTVDPERAAYIRAGHLWGANA